MRSFTARMVVVVCLAMLAIATMSAAAEAAPARPAAPAQVSCFFPKTKFLLHAGLAFGAFHRYIYKPYKAGTFTGSGKVAAIAKAALASVFVYHEIHEALKQVSCSHTLQVLTSPLTALLSAIQAAEAKLKAGGLPDIGALGGSFDQIGTQAGGMGLSIKDIAHSL